jgi:hypothetical protein
MGPSLSAPHNASVATQWGKITALVPGQAEVWRLIQPGREAHRRGCGAENTSVGALIKQVKKHIDGDPVGDERSEQAAKGVHSIACEAPQL